MTRWRSILVWSLPAGIALTLAARSAPGLVEVLYARGAYRGIAALLACLVGWIPFSVAEPLGLSAAVWIVWRAVRFAHALWRPREARAAIVKRAAGTCWIALGVVYLSFLLLWGLNYHRRPLATLLGFKAEMEREEERQEEGREATAAELRALIDGLVAQANELRAALPEDADGVLAPADPLAEAREAYAALARSQPLVRGFYGRPKPTLLLSPLGIAGIFSPFTGEPHLNRTFPAPLATATIGHEMAHQRGFASEDEATFVAILACRASPSDAARYSGVLESLLYAAADARRGDRRALRDFGLGEGPLRDLEAVWAWSRRYQSAATVLATRVNDAYLRANAQREGVESYGRVVDLLLAERRAGSAEPRTRSLQEK